MRIHLKLSRSKKPIPFNYQSYLTGAVHKWIGYDNEHHNKPSLYSFSWLQNIDVRKEGIQTNAESSFFISSYDEDIVRTIINGIMSDSSVFFGVSVSEVQLMNTPVFSSFESFAVASPVFIKRRHEGREVHIPFNDPDSGVFLTETLQKKLRLAGISDENVRVSFDNEYTSARTKVIYYKDIGNKANICPVMINGTPEQIAFAWNVGVGNSTGIGFGALK
ncbi:CRISPR-associated endoribonuclease Cas6 [Arcticibacter tournemirensis]|uniref:CRISPR-associated endoribonuclease Cas6 n=1 Tax=Arcticibacter tournemirensis TaxID=699437 RepID=A0A4Q0MA49_9SPHI|nr:CRISPR-associated endoribonuclease Cas6 [Arcticibacter tournemirensis]RXF70101.1 CRISPR-associated endoribonuclease Cas6 [Arcticibacter tournemirensis]